MNPRAISAFLVEDEPLCRTDFRHVLRSFPEVQLVGEADTLSAAHGFLENHRVDLLFLDLSVGRENGLDLLERLSCRPMVVALTAHPQHAARGFTLDLVDYVLKPVEEQRLRCAIEKVRLRLASAPLQPGRVTFLAEIDHQKTVLELTEIKGAESMGNYVLLHTTRGKAVKRVTFAQVSKKLPAPFFLVIGRGRIVARREIKGWNRDPDHRLTLWMASGEKHLVARSRTLKVLNQLKDN